MADIVLQFQGAEYRLPESKLFEVGEQIEDVARLYEITGWLRNPHFHKAARCLGIMLRAAGCNASDRDVYAEMIRSADKIGQDAYLISALYALIGALMNGAPESDGQSSGEQPASSSKRRSRSQSIV